VVVIAADMGVSALPRYISKDVWSRYQEEQHPRAMLFIPLHGLGTTDNYLTSVVMAPYGPHR